MVLNETITRVNDLSGTQALIFAIDDTACLNVLRFSNEKTSVDKLVIISVLVGCEGSRIDDIDETSNCRESSCLEFDDSELIGERSGVSGGVESTVSTVMEWFSITALARVAVVSGTMLGAG